MYLEMYLLNLFSKSHLGIHEIQAWWHALPPCIFKVAVYTDWAKTFHSRGSCFDSVSQKTNECVNYELIKLDLAEDRDLN